VIVGDVVDSRAVEDREALHGRLESGMERANDAVGDRLVAPFTTLKGVDEVGGVLTDPGRAYHAVRELTDAIHPTAIRFAVVWGDVDVAPTPTTSPGWTARRSTRPTTSSGTSNGPTGTSACPSTGPTSGSSTC